MRCFLFFFSQPNESSGYQNKLFYVLSTFLRQDLHIRLTRVARRHNPGSVTFIGIVTQLIRDACTKCLVVCAASTVAGDYGKSGTSAYFMSARGILHAADSVTASTISTILTKVNACLPLDKRGSTRNATFDAALRIFEKEDQKNNIQVTNRPRGQFVTCLDLGV